MKTSNIILLAIFASVLIWILMAFSIAKSKIKEVILEHPEFLKNEIEEDTEHQEIDLESFHTIIIEGSGDLYVEHSESYSFDQIIDDVNIVEVSNDTLFISVTGKDCILNVNKIRHINAKEDVWVEINNLDVDSINIFTTDNSELEVNKLKANFFNLITEKKSKVELNGVNFPDTEAEFFIRNYSTVQIDNTKGMALSVKKDADAKYKEN